MYYVAAYSGVHWNCHDGGGHEYHQSILLSGAAETSPLVLILCYTSKVTTLSTLYPSLLLNNIAIYGD